MDGQSEEDENSDHAFTVDIKLDAVNANPVAVNADLPIAKESPSAGGEQKIKLNGVTDHHTADELVSSVPSNGPILRNDLDASPRRELNLANAQSPCVKSKEVLIDAPSDISEKKVFLDQEKLTLQNEGSQNTHTVESDESRRL